MYIIIINNNKEQTSYIASLLRIEIKLEEQLIKKKLQ